MRKHRNNIERYRRLLRTRLTDLEPMFVERRITEERSKQENLSSSMFPLALKHLGQPPEAAEVPQELSLAAFL